MINNNNTYKLKTFLILSKRILPRLNKKEIPCLMLIKRLIMNSKQPKMLIR